MINKVIIKKIASESNVIRESKQIEEDPFQSFYGDDILAPSYDPQLLIKLPELSDILQQCIDAYKINICGFGVAFKYDIDFDKKEDTKKPEYQIQWARYENFFRYSNFDESFVEVMKKVIEDREKIGWGCLEVIGDGAGRPAGLEHIPGHTMRICKKDRSLVEIKVKVLDENGQEFEIIRKKRFEKYVQLQGTKKVYFKEFGDPRQLNCETGEYGENIPEDKQATSIIFFRIYCPYSEYGLPRYIGQLLNVQGNRKAEELNYKYFDEGRHIPLAIVVENGQLTEASIEQLRLSKGGESQYKYLVIEAESYEDNATVIGQEDGKKNHVNVKFEKLSEILNEDALFQEYCKNNRDKIRSAFRLHPIYTGESQDYTRATADTARQVTEEQVFQPEREAISFVFNNLLKPHLGINDVSMYFKAPKITDRSEIAKALNPYITSGTATPNMLVDALGELLGKEFEQIEEEWGNKPIQIILKEMELLKVQGMNQNNSANVQKADSVLNALKDLQDIVEGALADEEE